jgi:Tfp pilus assembly protein PilV
MSTLEIMIAFAILLVAVVGALDANHSSRYWALAADTSNEGLYKAKTALETMRARATADFESASSTNAIASTDPTDPADASCIAGGMCYYIKNTVKDISTCAKVVTATISWNVGALYPTTTTSLSTSLMHNEEIVSRYGDCMLAIHGGWATATPSLRGSRSLGGEMTTALDVLQKRAYVVSSSTSMTPQLRIYAIPDTVGDDPSLLGSYQSVRRMNDVDAVRDLSTGRIYAYVVEHGTSTQLSVIDATDASAPALSTRIGLSGVDPLGSYPQGWRVMAYGTRLYVTTRETLGPELHIFNIASPLMPQEVGGAATELSRTVNAFTVRDETIGTAVRRFLFLASSADTKEVSVYEVTNDTPIEIASYDLPGNENARAIEILGNRLYVGRERTSGGPELYAFAMDALIAGSGSAVVATQEVDRDIDTIAASGDVIVLGSQSEANGIETRTIDAMVWSSSDTSAGRIAVASFSPVALEFFGARLVAASSAWGGSEALSFFTAP